MINLDRYAKLLSKLEIRDRDSGSRVPFKLNRNQEITLERLKAQTSAGRPLRWITLKARRVGMSSLTDGLMFCYALNNPGLDCRIVAHLQDSVGKLFSVPKALANSLRRRFPDIIAKPTADKIVFPHEDGDSLLDIATAGTTSGGRGGGFYFLHLSEAAQFPNPGAMSSLLSTVPDHENTAISIESTAFGKVGVGEMFYQRWCAAVSGESEYIPIFLSWLEDPSCNYPVEILKRRELDEEEKDLVKHFKLTKSQLAWRRYAIIDKCHGSLDEFHQEYPITPEEAFVSSGNPAFQPDEMRLARSSVRPPIFRGYVDRKRQYHPTEKGPLLVWAKPDPNRRYYMGIDSARGADAGGKDFAAITIIDGITNETVARYAEQIGPEALAAVADTLGREYNQAMAIFELTGNLGLWAQSTIRDKFRYSNIYRRKGNDDKANKKNSVVLGWETNYRSREILITAYREALREGDLAVRDEALVTQMDLCQRDVPVGGRFECKRGHDDILFSGMLANIALRHYPPPGTKPASKSTLEDAPKNTPLYRDENIVVTLDRRIDISPMLIKHRKFVEGYAGRQKREKWLQGI